MGIGEEVPALIPISIAVVFLVSSLMILFVNYYEKTDALSMHLFAMNLIEKQVYSNNGIFNESILDSSNLALKSNKYSLMLKIKEYEGGKEWKYGDVSKPDLIVSFPCLVKNDSGEYNAIISLSMKR